MITATALISGCNSAKEEPQEFIGKQEVSLSSDLMTPEALWAMGRIGGVQPSPDGQKILYNVSYYSVKENKSHTVICLMNSDGSDNKMITKSPKSQGGAVWIDGGSKIAYLSGEDGVSSVWVMNADGTGASLLRLHSLTSRDKQQSHFFVGHVSQ